MPDPRKARPHMELTAEYRALRDTAEEVAGDPTLPEDVREFAASVMPILDSLDYGSAAGWAPVGPLQMAAFLRSGEVFASEADPDRRPPIWAN